MEVMRTMDDYWKHLRNHVDAASEESDKLLDIFNVNGNMKKRRSLLVAAHLDKRIDFLTVLGETQRAVELATLCMEYIVDAESNDNRNTSTGMLSEIEASFLRKALKYRFNWTINGKDNELLAQDALLILEKIVENKVAKKNSKFLQTDLLACVDLSLKSGDFGKAERYITMATAKIKPKGDADFIFEEPLFLQFIITSKLNGLNDEIKKHFCNFFKIISSDIDAFKKYGLVRAADIALIYFKYFKYNHVDNPSRTNVLQSVRYGI
ncbi:hypothetical protein [Geomonas propionica]|uniref:Uncharacterized protein n=1 Tax=Geomonas propionica TaxID=2798582 RepID=A0ABS0YT29_9BACT|nr:hypothetical protein [Geomonas propionica]MBJ6801135.1 hypothetical protein [Geomonas propionica]